MREQRPSQFDNPIPSWKHGNEQTSGSALRTIWQRCMYRGNERHNGPKGKSGLNFVTLIRLLLHTLEQNDIMEKIMDGCYGV